MALDKVALAERTDYDDDHADVAADDEVKLKLEFIERKIHNNF